MGAVALASILSVPMTLYWDFSDAKLFVFHIFQKSESLYNGRFWPRLSLLFFCAESTLVIQLSVFRLGLLSLWLLSKFESSARPEEILCYQCIFDSFLEDAAFYFAANLSAISSKIPASPWILKWSLICSMSSSPKPNWRTICKCLALITKFFLRMSDTVSSTNVELSSLTVLELDPEASQTLIYFDYHDFYSKFES